MFSRPSWHLHPRQLRRWWWGLTQSGGLPNDPWCKRKLMWSRLPSLESKAVDQTMLWHPNHTNRLAPVRSSGRAKSSGIKFWSASDFSRSNSSSSMLSSSSKVWRLRFLTVAQSAEHTIVHMGGCTLLTSWFMIRFQTAKLWDAHAAQNQGLGTQFFLDKVEFHMFLIPVPPQPWGLWEERRSVRTALAIHAGWARLEAS